MQFTSQSVGPASANEAITWTDDKVLQKIRWVQSFFL